MVFCAKRQKGKQHIDIQINFRKGDMWVSFSAGGKKE